MAWSYPTRTTNKAKEFYHDKATGAMKMDVLQRTLLMEIDELELLDFLKEDDPFSKSVAIEEVKELVDEENHYEDTPDKDLAQR